MKARKYYIVEVDLGKTQGSVQGGKRPAIIVQNNMGNVHSTTSMVVTLTKQSGKKQLPTHYFLKKEKYPFLGWNSLVLAEQIITVSESQITGIWGMLTPDDAYIIDNLLLVSLGLSHLVQGNIPAIKGIV